MSLGNILFGNFCPMCGNLMDIREKEVCRKCRNSLPYLKMPYCMKCARPLEEEEVYCDDCKTGKHWYDRVLCLYEHTDMVKKSVYDFKFENKRRNALWYAKEIKEKYSDYICSLEPEVIIPVPMYKKDKLKRGYNQAAVLAEELSKMLGIPMDEKYLLKTEKTKAQKELDKELRVFNLKKSLEINQSYSERNYKRIILADDIYTTGSTVDACSEVLKKAGTADITVVCISRGVI